MTGSQAYEDPGASLSGEYGPALYRFAYRFLQDRDRAQAVVEEVLRWARDHPERLAKATGSVRAVLFTVTRDLLTERWREDQARPRAARDRTAAAVPTQDAFDRMVEALQVEEALTDLSPEQRRVLEEVYYRGRSVAEAALELGIPPGTVKSRTHHALRALRAALARRGLTGEPVSFGSLLDASSFGDSAVRSLSARAQLPADSSFGTAEVHELSARGEGPR